MKVKDFCQCCSYDDYIWKIFVPNPDGHDSNLYHEVTVEDLSAAIHIFGEYEIDDDEGRAFLAQLFEVVNTALDNKDYGVAKIASMMNMTERTFRRRLKEVTDQSPKIFILAIQMERCAKLLLENPTKSIGEIAYLCGFEEASCFSHAFKRVYGCSPTAYREQNK